VIRRREPPGLHDRARGAMLGLAVGDALGAAVEWLHPDQIRSRYGGPLRDMVASGMWELGEWTDDTAMALELAASMADQGRYDENDVFGRYALWARSRPKDIGATVAAALSRSRSPDEARAAAAAHHAAEGRSAGNGSLMRTVPIAIRYRGDPGTIERVSRIDSSLTHHDPLAADACVWLNLTVAALIQGRNPPRSISDVARIADEAIAAGDAELAAAAQEQRGYVLTTLRIAFAAAFRHDAFEPAVVYAVNLGGDADTNGAVTGALAGARFGADAIPQRWVEPLQRNEVVSGLANRLTRT
jgi:ADP-ribosyl-[dinitrogen reductase] hydrolase